MKSPAIYPVPVTKFRDGDGNSGLLNRTPSWSNLGHDCKVSHVTLSKAKKSEVEFKQHLIDQLGSASSSVSANVVGNDVFSLVYYKSHKKNIKKL